MFGGTETSSMFWVTHLLTEKKRYWDQEWAHTEWTEGDRLSLMKHIVKEGPLRINKYARGKKDINEVCWEKEEE